MIAPGRLNQRVTIQQPVLTADGHGGNAVTWALRGVCSALVEPLSGREALQASQLTAVVSTGLTIWFRSDVSVKDRILVGSRTLEIESVFDPTGLREELRVLCSEVAA